MQFKLCREQTFINSSLFRVYHFINLSTCLLAGGLICMPTKPGRCVAAGLKSAREFQTSVRGLCDFGSNSHWKFRIAALQKEEATEEPEKKRARTQGAETCGIAAFEIFIWFLWTKISAVAESLSRFHSRSTIYTRKAHRSIAIGQS